MPSDLSPQELRRIANRRVHDRKKRKKLRDRLRREGYSDELIEEEIARRRWQDLVARHGSEYEARKALRIRAELAPDDTGYHPDPGDSLLRGAGRADGMTAKVAKRRSTITEYQYRRTNGSGDNDA